MKGSPREPRDPTGSIEEVTMGAFCEGQPERSAELRSGVGPAHSTVEALKGNERGEGRNPPGGSPSEKAGVRTQSRVALPLKLWRVYEAAQRNKRPGLRHCCIMSMCTRWSAHSAEEAECESWNRRGNGKPTSRTCKIEFAGSLPAGSHRALSAFAGAQSLYSEIGWWPKAARCACAGRQNRPRRGGRGP